MGFTKLDEGILQSSIMSEPATTFKVWIALLASCLEDGIAPVSAVFLATVCHLPQSIVDRALNTLMQPDERSRSMNDDGRRIKRVDGGFQVVNYMKYRDFTYSSRREAVRKREYRNRKNGTSGDMSQNVPLVPGHSVLSSLSLSSSSLKITEIIEYLNTKTGKKFSPRSAGTIKHIQARLAEGRTIEDFRHVIDVKAAKWLGDPKMDDFLRPDTLFRPSNFESYLNERMILPKAPAHLRIGGGSEPKPMTQEQKAEQKRKLQEIADAMDLEFGPKIAAARAAGDMAQVKKLSVECSKAFEDKAYYVIYPSVKPEARP